MSRVLDKCRELERRNRKVSVSDPIVKDKHVPVCKYCMHSEIQFSYFGNYFRCLANEHGNADQCDEYVREPGIDDDFNLEQKND